MELLEDTPDIFGSTLVCWIDSMIAKLKLMTATTAAAISIAVFSPISAAQDGHSSLSERLIGSWRLVSIETIRPNGEVIYPFYGKHPTGMLIYDRSGSMSVQIVSDPMPTRPSTDSREKFLASPVGEKVIAVDGYYAYFGTWTVGASGNSVTHHIEQSLYPGERGEDATRLVSFQNGRLVLLAKTHEMGEDHQRKLVWERIPADH